MESRKKLYWIDLSRFDTKVNKSPWLEMSKHLIKANFDVNLLCGKEKDKFYPDGYDLHIRYFKSLDYPLIFRLTLLLNITWWLLLNCKKEDVVIVRPGSLLAGWLVKLFKRSHIHMDVRTVPVEVNSWRDKVDKFLYWTVPLKTLRKIPDSFSFITLPLKESVEREFSCSFSDYVIWSSAVDTKLFYSASQTYKEEKKTTNGKVVFFYHGTITHNRGVVEIVRAIDFLGEEIKNAIKLVIVGKGNALKDVLNEVKKLQLETVVEVLGFQPYDSIPAHIQASDCCICPLPNRPEWNVSSPLKVYEYISSKKPVILTPIPAHESVFRPRNIESIVWSNGTTPKDFSDAITLFYANSEKLLKSAESISFDEIYEWADWESRGKLLSEYILKSTEK